MIESKFHNSESGGKPWSVVGPYAFGSTYQSFSFATLYNEYLFAINANYTPYAFPIITKYMLENFRMSTGSFQFQDSVYINNSAIVPTVTYDVNNNRIRATCLNGGSTVPSTWTWCLFYR